MKDTKQEIHQEVLKRIISLEYTPGSFLNEKALAEEFNCSRTPVRESLLTLSNLGLIEMRPRVGIQVTNIDLHIVKHTYEVKRCLEGMAAALAAQHMTDEGINGLFAVVEHMKQLDPARDYIDYIKADQLFHKRVLEATDNTFLVKMLFEVNAHTARFLNHIRYVVEDPNWFHASLLDIANAIRDRDPARASTAGSEHAGAFLTNFSKTFFR